MIDLEETHRQKIIRYILIGIGILFVIVGISAREGSQNSKKPASRPMIVQVLNEAEENKNPFVVVAKKQDDQQLLIKYEIDLANQYYFRVIESITLQDSIIEVFTNGSNIWIQTEKHDWLRLSETLKVIESHSDTPTNVESSDKPFTILEQEPVVIEVVSDNERYKIETKSDTLLKSIHSISIDESVWLLVYDDHIAIAQTK